MNTIRDLIGAGEGPAHRASNKLVLSECGVGVEVELEHTHRLCLPSRPWRVVDEGSLHQDGLELIFYVPLAGRDITEALATLEAHCEDSGVTVGNDTSLHVHIDVRDLTCQQVWKFMMLHTMFESALFNFCGGETREANIFCIGTKYAPDKIQRYSEALAALLAGRERAFITSLNNAGRYSSMNTESVHRFGSLEFRGHRGEWRAAPVLRWINILQCLKKAVLDNTIPWKRPYLTVKRLGARQMAHDVFGKYLSSLNYDGFVPDVERGCQYARAMVNVQQAQLRDVLKGCRNNKRYSMRKKYQDKNATPVPPTPAQEAVERGEAITGRRVYISTPSTSPINWATTGSYDDAGSF